MGVLVWMVKVCVLVLFDVSGDGDWWCWIGCVDG